VNESDSEKAVGRLTRWQADSNTEDPIVLRREMKQVMQQCFGVFRDASPMQQGLKKMHGLYERLQHARLSDRSRTFNMARIECLELDNLMEVALATAASAEQRTESRGAHCRYDYKERDDVQWLKHTLYFKEGGRLAYRSVNRKPHHIEPFPLKERE